jgi:hypothetical protein
LFLKLSENKDDFWICSDFYDNVWQNLVGIHLSDGVYFCILWILKQALNDGIIYCMIIIY